MLTSVTWQHIHVQKLQDIERCLMLFDRTCPRSASMCWVVLMIDAIHDCRIYQQRQTQKVDRYEAQPPNDGSDGSNSHNHNHNNRNSHNKHNNEIQWAGPRPQPPRQQLLVNKTFTYIHVQYLCTQLVVASTCFFTASSAYCYWCFFFCTCSVNDPITMIKKTPFLMAVSQKNTLLVV